MNKPASSGFGQKALMPLVSFILFSALFAGFCFGLKPDLAGIESQELIAFFQKWSPFTGAAFAFLSMLGMYIIRLFGLRRIKVGGALLIIIGFIPWLIFGYDLVYLEPRYAVIAIAIIAFLGKPMLYASAVMVGLGVIWLLLLIIGKIRSPHALKILILLLAPFMLSGCLGDFIELSCLFVPDPDHCYQAAAVQNADPYGCEQVSGADFKTGSNPPRDKCYLMIAENTGDYNACNFIVGGLMSYTKEDCIYAAAIKNEDPTGCQMLKGLAFENCKNDVGQTITTDKLAKIAEDIENAKSALGRNPEDPELQKALIDLQTKKKDMYDFAPAAVTSAYFKENREKIMEDIEDEDVKSAIAKQFTDYRNSHPNEDMDLLLKKMQDMKDQQETVKNLDEQVNEVFDEMKGNLSDFVTENVDEATGASEFSKEMQKRGVEWFKENGGDRVKRGIENLEWMKEKYDKTSEQYEQISEQIGKLKKVYDEANEVYKKVDAVNKLVAEGKIDKGKARVLHGAIMLGKGLEYATEYVPVFGSTVSKITTATFEATVKLGTERAKRTTALDKCIEDPEHCDTEGISAY
jgi:hypothetical protein